MLTNEMKRHAVIVALKADLADLEIAGFHRVAWSFVYKIRKELEKENNNVMSVSKRKKNIPHVPIQWEHPNLFIKLSRQLMKTKVNQWGQLQKSLKRRSEGVFMKTFDTNLTWWREVNLFLKNRKKTT